MLSVVSREKSGSLGVLSELASQERLFYHRLALTWQAVLVPLLRVGSCNPGAFMVIFWVEMHCGPKNTDQVKFSILWGSSNFKYMLRIHQSSSISWIVLYFSLYTLMAAQFFARPWLLLQSSAFLRSYIRSWERNRPRLWLVVGLRALSLARKTSYWPFPWHNKRISDRTQLSWRGSREVLCLIEKFA